MWGFLELGNHPSGERSGLFGLDEMNFFLIAPK
jgi:hypothetical protein